MVGGGAFTFYLATLVPTFGWGDSSELTTAAYRLGIAHSPGYPLYVMLGKVFTLLPFGSVAVRVNLMSAVWGAVAVALVYLLGRQLGGIRRAGLLAAMAAAFGSSWWQQSTRAEVYTLHLALLAAALLLVLAWRSKGEQTLLRWAAVPVGLGLAHHPMMLLAIPGLAVLAASGRERLRLRAAGKAALTMVGCGVLPYLYIVVRAPAAPPPQLNAPTSFSGLLHLVIGAGGSRALFAMSGAEMWRRLGEVVSQLPCEVGMVTVLLAAAGLWHWWRCDRWLLLGWLLVVVVGMGFALSYRIVDPQGYYLPTFLMICLAGATGTGVVLGWCRRQSQWLAWPLGMLLLLVVGSGSVNCILLHRYEPIYQPEDFARGACKVMAPGSLVLADWWCVGPLGYLQYVEGQRPDLQLTAALSLTNERALARLMEHERLARYPAVYAAEVLTGKVARLRWRYPISGSGPLYRVLVTPPRPQWEPARHLAARFGTVRLHRVALAQGTARQGEAIWVTLAWSGPPGSGTRALLALDDRQGKRVWRDMAPVAGGWPDDRWQAGKAAVERRAVFVPSDCPPGDYRLIMLVRDGRNQRLGRQVDLGALTVVERGSER